MPEPNHPRKGKALLITLGIAIAVVIPVTVAAIALGGTKHSAQSTVASAQTSPQAEDTSANLHWASAMCTNLLQWKTAVQRDARGLKLSLGAPAQILDAIATTKRTLNELEKLGLPPTATSAQARAETARLHSEIASRVKDLEDAASSVASGNFAAIGTLLSDLKKDAAIGPVIAGDLRHVVSADLGLSLVETPACRQLVGVSA
jgi:hypothetical protein